ncbi:ATP-binding protein [Vibrio mexicanus]|uniref:ATP-binding protein n=1 Tax=Vibrio mexicanus TaxID=1004326 RepID=UPI00063CD66A|nr:ATP-binding protein [Vibrio mexicanus]
MARLSIKQRLVILCLVPLLAIVGFSTFYALEMHHRLSALDTLQNKVTAEQDIASMIEQLYNISSLTVKAESIDDALTDFKQDILTFSSKIELESISHHHGDGLNQSLMMNLANLMKAVDSLGVGQSVQSMMFELNRANDILLQITSDLHQIESHTASVKVHRLELMLKDLHWLYFWMKREAMLAREMQVMAISYDDYLVDYFRLTERQNIYLDKLAMSAIDSDLEGVVNLFESRDFLRLAFTEARALAEQATPAQLDQYVQQLEQRNSYTQEQFKVFSDLLSEELNAAMRHDRITIIVLTIALVLLLTFCVLWGMSAFVRINNKLQATLNAIRNLRSEDSSEKVTVDGSDEFTDFATELNMVISKQRHHSSALKEAKDLAEAANRAKSSFLANMSHEIRTPLNGIIGMTEILGDSHLNTSQKEILKDIDTSSHVLLVLINDILDLSKIESGNIVLAEKDTDISQVCYDCVNMVLPKALKQHTEVMLSLDKSLPTMLLLDELRVKQILMNLLTNAIKFTKNGFVTLDVKYDYDLVQGGLMIQIVDSGIGIEKDKQEVIFQPFHQAEAGITRQYGGTGLGLTICRELVELMDGSISVESSKGMGSCFSVTLPLTQSPIQPNYPSISSDIVLVTNGSSYTEHIVAECKRLNIDITPYPKVEHVIDNHEKCNVVLYCQSESSSTRKDIAQLRARYTHVEVIALQHHLMQTPDKAPLVTAMATLPILGAKFRQQLETIIGRSSSDSAMTSLSFLNGADTRGSQILVVEDNLMNQKIAGFFLDKAGLSYTIASNGEEALNLIVGGAQYSAVLMDCMMPVMDGLTATKKIREWEKEQGNEHRLPIVALTASVLEDEINSCIEAGMDSYLLKPYKSKQLFEKLQEFNIAS